MECNETKFDITEYCRICFNRTNGSLEKMLELDTFLPIIRCIAQTKVYYYSMFLNFIVKLFLILANERQTNPSKDL